MTIDFQSLPAEYQQVIRLAQDRFNITIAPLQLLVGGWSGAMVYLVSVASNGTGRLEHCILKLDRKGKNAKSDEVTRHNTVMEKSEPGFARAHVAELVFDRVEHDGAIAIFYRIAGQSLLKYRPLSNFGQQTQLKTIFRDTHQILMEEWNADLIFKQAVHPQKVLQTWLGFRLDAGGNIERFLQESLQLNPDIAGFLIQGNVFPNPLVYARKPEKWGRAREIDIATGYIHGDLNTNNILVKFDENRDALEGYYLIDFALFKEGMPLFYDQRYLEISYLMQSISQVGFEKIVEFLMLMSETDIPDPTKAPIEMAGVAEVIRASRAAFAAWVQQEQSSLSDDLWGQYHLAAVAAGLSYCHKAGQADEVRLAGLIYAAANLKRYLKAFNLSLPTDVELLYDQTQSGSGAVGTPIVQKPRHNFPVQSTPFIGRAGQIVAVKNLLLSPQTRLVTLTGPGGTGKTRLSLRVAEKSIDHFPDGAFFVPLADDTDAIQFVSRLAQQLEVREAGRALLESIKDYLRDKNLLLVLDNFEQLVSAAPVVADLLAAAPQLKIITSSRMPLQLHGEREYPVPPMDLPKTGELSIDRLLGSESVNLFVERARASNPNFALTSDNAFVIAEICRRLDGLPLALELAAARIKLLPPQAILSRLDDRLKLLTGGARDLPSRHQTLRRTLEWSYSLLNNEEKSLYARLSVFVGGFTLEAAETICNAEGNFDILEGLTSLVNNSLLRQEEIDGEPRFSMLETIRAYALECLDVSGETESLRAAHAHYFGKIIVNQVMIDLYSSKALQCLNWIERELDNIRATLAWCTTNPAGVELGAGIVWVLMWFYYRRGYFSEGRMWTERVFAALPTQDDSASRAMVLAVRGFLAMWQGEQEFAITQLQKSLVSAQRREDEQMMPLLLLGNGVVLINMGRDSAAEPLLKEAQALFEQANMPYFHVLTTVHLGNVELGLGNIEQARAQHEAGQAEARLLHENWILSFALNNLGEVARTLGQYELARNYYEEAESLLQDQGDQGDMARFVHTLGYIAQHEKDFARAESQFRKSLTMFRRLGNRRGIAECLAGLAGLKARRGDIQGGGILLSAAESLLLSTGGAWWPADRIEVDQNRELIRSALSEDEFAAAQNRGRLMTIDQAIDFGSNDQE
jgi:predicted ATPase